MERPFAPQTAGTAACQGRSPPGEQGRRERGGRIAISDRAHVKNGAFPAAGPAFDADNRDRSRWRNRRSDPAGRAGGIARGRGDGRRPPSGRKAPYNK